MSRWLAALAAVALACRQDPGIDIVRVPAQAYLAPDAAAPAVQAQPDAGFDASGVFMLCVDAPPPNDGKPDEDEDKGDGTQPDVEMSSDFPECPLKRDDRNLDPRVTQRHRGQGEERACCYRQSGSSPQPVRTTGGE